MAENEDKNEASEDPRVRRAREKKKAYLAKKKAEEAEASSDDEAVEEEEEVEEEAPAASAEEEADEAEEEESDDGDEGDEVTDPRAKRALEKKKAYLAKKKAEAEAAKEEQEEAAEEDESGDDEGEEDDEEMDPRAKRALEKKKAYLAKKKAEAEAKDEGDDDEGEEDDEEMDPRAKRALEKKKAYLAKKKAEAEKKKKEKAGAGKKAAKRKPKKKKDTKPPKSPTQEPVPAGEGTDRRGFFRQVGWGAFSLYLAFLGGCFARFFFPRILFEPPAVFKAGKPEEYNVGTVSTRFKESNRVWIVREPDRFFVIFARCTHLGCTPNWVDSANKFKCPCHGSGYTKEGINFEGPAPRPMPHCAIWLGPDGSIMVDTSQKFDYANWNKERANLYV